MKKLFLLAALCLPAFAQTAVNDRLYLQSSAPWKGQITVSWPAFTNCAGAPIAKGSRSYIVTDGNIGITLWATDCAAPSFAYSVRYVSGGNYSATWSEDWAIPSSPSIVTLAAVRQSSTMQVFISQVVAPSSTLDGQVPAYNIATGKLEMRSVAGVSGNVTSVAGRTGDVVLFMSDISGLVSALSGKESTLTFSSPLSRSGNTVSCPTCGTGLVTSVAGRTGDVVLAQSDITGLVAALAGKQDAISGAPGTWPSTFAPPLPTASTIGGVKSLTCTGTDKISAIGTDGLPVCSADQTGAPGSGISSLNGLSGSTQTFATPGTTGTAPGWSSTGTAHTLNIPLASASSVTAGLISKTDYDTFNGKVSTTRTVNGHALSADVAVTKGDVGLGNADNTSDANKPVSTAQQAAIDAAQPVFAGSIAVTVASSATPAFSFGATSAKSPTVVKFTPIVNVTGPTFTNLSAGARVLLFITTDGTHTWSWNSTISDNVCSVWTQSAGTTIAEIFVDPDGSTLHGGACLGGPTGLISLATTGTTCASSPASGQLCVWADAADNTVKAKDSSGNVYVMPKSAASRTANQFCTHITSAGICSAAAIAGADLPLPGASSLGGVKSLTCTGTDKISAIGTDGLPVCSADQTSAGGITASSTDTLTNKTIDAEGTGNSITVPFFREFVPAVCQGTFASIGFSLPTSNAPAPVCRTGTNTQFGVAQFTATGQNIQGHFTLPADWTGAIDLFGKYLSETATTGNAVWGVKTACVADAATGDPSWNTIQTITDAVKGTILQFNDFSQTGLTTTGCAAGNEFFFYLELNSGTTATGNHDLIALSFKYRRTM